MESKEEGQGVKGCKRIIIIIRGGSLCQYVLVAVLSCVESSTVAGLASCPLSMIAHTVTTPSPSPAVYNIRSRPIVTPEEKK